MTEVAYSSLAFSHYRLGRSPVEKAIASSGFSLIASPKSRIARQMFLVAP